MKNYLPEKEGPALAAIRARYGLMTTSWILRESLDAEKPDAKSRIKKLETMEAEACPLSEDI